MAGDGGGRPSELGDSILRPANSALSGDSIGGGRSSLGLRRHRRAAASFSACFCARADARRFAGGGCCARQRACHEGEKSAIAGVYHGRQVRTYNNQVPLSSTFRRVPQHLSACRTEVCC